LIDGTIRTGDFIGHYLPSGIIVETLKQTVSMLKEYFPTEKIIFALGNNDFYPNYAEGLDSVEIQSWLHTIAPFMDVLLPVNARSTFRIGGYFSYDIDKYFSIIAINTVIYSPRHKNYSNSIPDPLDQFAWLESQLVQAIEEDKKLYIIGHIPPCSIVWNNEEQWYSEYVKKYNNLTKIYSDVIAAQVFGHTHRDDFKLFSENNKPFSSLVISSSLSPNSNTNPSYRIYSYSDGSYALDDYSHYYTDLFTVRETLHWNKEYTFSDAYSKSDVGTSSLSELSESIYKNPELYLQWQSRYDALYSPIRKNYYCSIKYTIREEYLNCIGEA